MSRIKDLIIERENVIIDLIRRMNAYDDGEILDQWCAQGLPYDEDDFDALFDIVVEDDIYEHTIKTAEEFLRTIKNNKENTI